MKLIPNFLIYKQLALEEMKANWSFLQLICTKFTDNVAPAHLKYINVELVKPSILPENPDLVDLQSKKPIDGKYSGTCHGDSGSGSFGKNKDNEKYYLVGVTSMGKNTLVILNFIKIKIFLALKLF